MDSKHVDFGPPAPWFCSFLHSEQQAATMIQIGGHCVLHAALEGEFKDINMLVLAPCKQQVSTELRGQRLPRALAAGGVSLHRLGCTGGAPAMVGGSCSCQGEAPEPSASVPDHAGNWRSDHRPHHHRQRPPRPAFELGHCRQVWPYHRVRHASPALQPRRYRGKSGWALGEPSCIIFSQRTLAPGVPLATLPQCQCSLACDLQRTQETSALQPSSVEDLTSFLEALETVHRELHAFHDPWAATLGDCCPRIDVDTLLQHVQSPTGPGAADGVKFQLWLDTAKDSERCDGQPIVPAGREGGVGWRLERADKDERGARLQPVFAWGCRPVTCTKGRQSRWSDELGGRGSRLRSSQHTHDGGCTGAHACRRRAQVNTGAGYTLHARNESLEKSARKNKLETEGFACAVAPHSTYHSSVRRWLRQ